MEPMNAHHELVIHMEHTKPVEVADFVKALNGVNSLYSSYVAEHGICKEIAGAKLYVEKIEEGSILLYLCEIASANLLPLAENANTVLEFGAFMKKIVDYFAHGKGENPHLQTKILQSAHDVFAPTSRDHGGKTSIYVRQDGATFYNCSFNFSEGNCAQNCLRNEAEERKASKTGGVYKRMTMRVYQFCGDLGKNKANRGIIDEISEKQLALFFETDELKEQILGGDVNPTKMLYQVDVVLQTAEGKPCAYKVIALHDAMPIPPTE